MSALAELYRKIAACADCQDLANTRTQTVPGEPISKVHGKARKQDGIIYFAMYHPAAALHQQSLRQTIEADMLKIPALLTQAEPVEEVKKEDEPQQLSMF